MKFLAFSMVLSAGLAVAWAIVNDEKTGFPLVCQQDFEDPACVNGFMFCHPEPWFLTGGKGGGRALEFAGKGNYETKVRSPFIIGLIGDHRFGENR